MFYNKLPVSPVAGLVLAFWELLLNTGWVSGQNATITEGSQSIKTYSYSDPNPVPDMAINATVAPFYPWFVFDGYSDTGSDRDWRVITMENKYIQLWVLPGVGGKVWGATEKSTGREFIYRNHVLKFRAIGIRGPWTSGGIEHNFGLDLGHAPWTSSAVDYALSTNPDGSVTCTVGGLDLASRTQWRVSIRLPKDKAYFETRSMWYNPTPLHDAYLSWENAGFKATDDLQFYFPGTYYIGHDGAVNPWPVDSKGRNLSLYSENNFGSSKSYHVSGLYTGWFGGYWHNTGFGFAHYAPYSDAPGKKIWIWSLAREGAIWEDLLTDNDGQYIEAQSGVKFNQANLESGFDSPFNQLFIRPFYTDTKTEYWFPVLNTQGIADASPAGTLNVSELNDSLKISVCPNTLINDTLRVFISGKVVLSTFVKLSPMQVFQKEMPLAADKYRNIRVTIGNNLLSYDSDQEGNKIDRPVKTTTDQDFNSSEHMFRLAEDENAMRNYDKALEYYLGCLKMEPTHSRALSKVAELFYRKADYDEAHKYARLVLENDTYDPDANFISGTIQRRLGNLVPAEAAFSISARNMEYRSGSYFQIAALKMQKGDFEGALGYTEKSLDYNRLNVAAYESEATCYRKLGKFSECDSIAGLILKMDPLNHYARFEQYLLNPQPESLRKFNSGIRNELPCETYLELALEYADKALFDEAVKVLEQSPPYPTVYYWLAYLHRELSPVKSSYYLKKAEDMSPFLVFPFRLETIPVLTWALTQNDTWKTKYYLGLIYWHILRNEKARELFAQCGDIPDFAPFYIARAILFGDIESDNCYPCTDYDKAIRLNPEEWRTWHFLNSYLGSVRAFQHQLGNAEQAYHKFPAHAVIGIDYAKALINSGKYKECVMVLEKVKILPQEGAHEGHDIFETANLGMAVELLEQRKFREALKYLDLSEKWPENLGAGKPFEPETRIQDYIAAYCYAQLGDPKMSGLCSDRIMDYSREHWGNASEPANTYVSMQVLENHGKHQEVVRAMNEWKTEQDSLMNRKISTGSSSPEIQWVLSKYTHDDPRALKLENEITQHSGESRFRLFLKALILINPKENEK